MAETETKAFPRETISARLASAFEAKTYADEQLAVAKLLKQAADSRLLEYLNELSGQSIICSGRIAPNNISEACTELFDTQGAPIYDVMISDVQPFLPGSIKGRDTGYVVYAEATVHRMRVFVEITQISAIL